MNFCCFSFGFFVMFTERKKRELTLDHDNTIMFSYSHAYFSFSLGWREIFVFVLPFSISLRCSSPFYSSNLRDSVSFIIWVKRRWTKKTAQKSQKSKTRHTKQLRKKTLKKIITNSLRQFVKQNYYRLKLSTLRQYTISG